MSNELWAVTCYYNPSRYRRKLANYREFRKRLGVPLVCVEFEGDALFELGEEDAEILVRTGDGSVLWQKERLLNVAWDRVPADCRKIAWLDCDLVFETPEWIGRTIDLLDEHPLVQPFSCVHDLPPEFVLNGRPFPRVAEPNPSVVKRFPRSVSGYSILSDAPADGRTISGKGWAARREVFDGLGLYDACVLGSGNRAHVAAWGGRDDEGAAFFRMNREWEGHYRDWAARCRERIGGGVAFAHVDAPVFHLWHGDVADRRYLQRHVHLAEHAFDPARDVRKGTDGAWVWSSGKAEMHEAVRRYFDGRREDG